MNTVVAIIIALILKLLPPLLAFWIIMMWPRPKSERVPHFASTDPVECPDEAGGVELSITLQKPTRLKIQAYGLMPGTPSPVFELYRNGRGPRFQVFSNASRVGKLGRDTYIARIPKRDRITTHWVVRVIHKRGIACATYHIEKHSAA